MLTVCAHVVAEDAKVAKLLADKRVKTARYRPAPGTAYVRAHTMGTRADHLHVDCALREVFQTSQMPKATHKKAEVLRFIERFSGCAAEVGITGVFVFARSALPEGGLVRPLLLAAEGEGVGVRLTEGTLSFDGAPVSRIKWFWDAGRDDLVVHLRAARDETLTPSYLVDSLAWVDRLFRIFVLMASDDTHQFSTGSSAGAP